MGAARTFFATAGTLAVVGVSAVAGLAARDKHDFPQTYAQGGVPRLLASRVGPIQIGEEDYFRDLSLLLKEVYVEPVTDDRKLVSGAVKGMVNALGDRNSQFFAPDEFRAYKAMRQGKFEGIGVWVGFEGGTTPKDADAAPEDRAAETPRLTIISVTPTGPAAKAGLKPGDAIEEVNGEWVVNSGPILAYRKVQDDYRAKKITLQQANEVRKQLKAKLDHSMMPLKARERLILGTSGDVKVVVVRNGKTLPELTIAKAASEANVESSGAAIALLFNDGAPERLAAAIKGKSQATIDLRGDSLGDFDTMRKCLALVAPAGEYGQIDRVKGGATKLTVEKGATTPIKLSLLVDRSTRGPAQIFALALQAKGIAKIAEGSEAMVPDRAVSEVVQLADESGYTLATGEYRVDAKSASSAKTAVAATGAKTPRSPLTGRPVANVKSARRPAPAPVKVKN